MVYPYRDRFFLDPGQYVADALLTLALTVTTHPRICSRCASGAKDPGPPRGGREVRGVENTGLLGQEHMALGAAIA